MRLSLRCGVIGLLAVTLCHPQQTAGPGVGPPMPPVPRTQPSDGTPHHQAPVPNFERVPDPRGNSPHQMTANALQDAHEQNLEDTSRLIKLSTELKWDLANHDREVLDLATVKKMDEIERLIRKIRARIGKK